MADVLKLKKEALLTYHSVLIQCYLLNIWSLLNRNLFELIEFRRRCDPEHRESVEGVHQGVRRPRSGADSQRGTAAAAQAPRRSPKEISPTVEKSYKSYCRKVLLNRY